MELEKTKKLALMRYKLIQSNLPKTMQTILFNQAKKENITIKELEKLIAEVKKEIEKEKQEKAQKELQKINFTCNIF